MKIYRNGNNRVTATMHYICKVKTEKANRIFANLIKQFYPDCKKASLSTSWAVNFENNDLIIEKAMFKIICAPSILHEGTYFYAIIVKQ